MNRFLHAVKRNVVVGLMMVFVLGISQSGWGQTTYTWNSSTAVWTTTTAWTPTRTTPATNDILVFSSGTTVTPTSVPTQTIGKLQLSNNTTVNLQAGGANTLTIGGGSSALSVASGSALNINGTNAMVLTIATGSTASISGSMTFSTAVNTFTAADASGITFNSGAVFTQSAGNTGNIFGNGTSNSVVFASGSTFVQNTGANPFQKAQPASVVVFQTGSLFKFQQNAAPSFVGRTYANLEINFATFSQIVTGSTGVLTLDNLTITSGVLNLNLTGGLNIKGNISVASGQTLTFNPASANTLTFNGSSAQSITNSGGTLTFAANEAVVIANTGSPTPSVTFNQAQTISGSMTVNSGSILATGGTLTLSGTPAINGSFQINQSGSASSGTWSYGAGATLIFNNSSGSFTVSGTPVFWPATNGPTNVTIQGAGGITMSIARTVPASGTTGVFQTAAAITTANNLTLNGTAQINSGGSLTGSPTYGASSTLIYNQGSSVSVGNEWSGAGPSAGVGVPQNVTIQGTGTSFNLSSARALSGTLTISTPATLILGAAYSGLSGVSGILQLNSSGSVNSAPTYSGTLSTLVYNQGSTPTMGSEWGTGSSVGSGVPSNVTVQNSTNVSLGGARSVPGALTLTSGTLSIGSNTLTLNGTVTNTTGTLNGTSSSILSLGGSSAQSLAFATGASLASLNVAKSSGTSTLTSVGDTLRIYTGIDLNSNTGGVLDLNGKEVKMKSNSTGTAYIGQSSTTSLTGATAITVERFIPQNSNRAWRLLAVPTTGSQTINSAWQNGQASGVAGTAGLGSWITSNVAGATSAGYDAQTPGNSLLTYNQTSNLWVGVTSNTTTTQLAPSGTDGYMLYVRGDRTSTNGNSTITPTTLFSRGGIKQNDQSAITVPAETNGATGNYVMIGNPFASTINLPSMTSTGFTNANALSVSVYDSKIGTLGGFVVLQYDGTDYKVATSGSTTYGGVGTVVNTIQSGQAFFVQSQAALGTLAIPESAKRTASSVVFRQTAARLPAKRYLFTELYAGQDTAARFMDGTTQYFDPSFSNLVDYADARKLGNFSENLGISNGVATLSVEKRGAIASADTIFFSISNMKIQGYQLRFIAAKLTQPGVRAFLEDSYLHTSTPVALNDTTTVNFTVDANAGSYATNRFRLVFKTRPVAIADNNNGTDGMSAVSNGTAKSISVYPNPVTGGIVNISFKNEPAGNYRVVLYTMKGQPLFSKTMSHAGGNAAQSLLIGKGIANGSYKLAVIHPDNTRTEQTIIVTK